MNKALVYFLFCTLFSFSCGSNDKLKTPSDKIEIATYTFQFPEGYKLINIIKILIFNLFILFSCSQNVESYDSSSTAPKEQTATQKPITESESQEPTLPSDMKSEIEQVALSFHQWNIESILDESNSIAYNFEIVESDNGKCELDSVGYFKNLRALNTISEKFIRSEWKRVQKCASFLDKLNWEAYNSADAYAYQDYCDIYYHYWTRTQEPYHGVEVRNIEKVNDHYLLTLAFFHDYDGKEYSENSLPVVKVENEQGSWKITEIDWIQKP